MTLKHNVTWASVWLQKYWLNNALNAIWKNIPLGKWPSNISYISIVCAWHHRLLFWATVFHTWSISPRIQTTNLQTYVNKWDLLGRMSWCLYTNITLPKTNSLPLKMSLPKRKVVFQPPIFRGYVSVREGSIMYFIMNILYIHIYIYIK